MPQRGAKEILRSPSIMATSIAARLCSFSRLTSVTAEPVVLEKYRAGIRFKV